MSSHADLLLKRKCIHLYKHAGKTPDTMTDYYKGEIHHTKRGPLARHRQRIQKKKPKKTMVKKSEPEPVPIPVLLPTPIPVTEPVPIPVMAPEPVMAPVPVVLEQEPIEAGPDINKLGPMSFTGMDTIRQVTSASDNHTKETYRKGKQFWSKNEGLQYRQKPS